jgi:hypothetical protein
MIPIRKSHAEFEFATLLLTTLSQRLRSNSEPPKRAKRVPLYPCNELTEGVECICILTIPPVLWIGAAGCLCDRHLKVGAFRLVCFSIRMFLLAFVEVIVPCRNIQTLFRCTDRLFFCSTEIA